MHVLRSFPSGTAIANKLIAAGGFDGGFTLASAETLEACLASPTPTPTPSGDALWYNGDFDGVNGLANEIDTASEQASSPASTMTSSSQMDPAGI